MSMPLIETDQVYGDVIYPESDDTPMAENALQAGVIRMLVSGFMRLFDGRNDMFVGGDFFWYPVEGDNKTVTAPDVTVIADLARPIDYRTMGSYRQWVFGGRVLLAVEVWSPSNSAKEMIRKLEYYERHGVAECWMFDPQDGALVVYVRVGDQFRCIANAGRGWTSPNTGVRLAVVGSELFVSDPDGRPWLTHLGESRRADEMAARADEMAARAEQAEAENAALRADLARLRG